MNVHGGGFATGDKKYNRFYACQLAEMGYRVGVLNYRLIPEVNIKQQIQDIASGIRHSVESYGNGQKGIYLTGDSAGAFLVTLLCGIWQKKELQLCYDVEIPDICIRAAGLTGTPNTIDTFPKFMMPFYRKNRCLLLNGCEELQDCVYTKDIWSAEFPPVFLMSCEEDLYYRNVCNFHKWLNEKGTENILRSCEKKAEGRLYHCFNVIQPELLNSRKMNEAMIKWFDK